MRQLVDLTDAEIGSVNAIEQALTDQAFDTTKFVSMIEDLRWRLGPLELLQQQKLATKIDRFFSDVNHPQPHRFPDTLTHWLLDIKTNRDRKYFRDRNSLLVDKKEHRQFIKLLEATEDIIRDRLARLVALHFYSDAIPRKSGLLYFTSNLDFCLIVDYEVLSGGGVVIRFVDFIEEPTGILELDSVADLHSPESRRFCKSLIASGFKIVVHNNTLTCIDRRIDSKVFGPSIDTLILAQIANNVLFNPRSMLEIGCGNGAITASCANNLASLQRIVAIDSHPESIMCTNRNLKAAGLWDRQSLKIHLMLGKFDQALFSGTPYDIIVCNPPYLPFSEDSVEELDYGEQRSEATTGHSLIESILIALPDILSRSGSCLMMFSSVCRPAVDTLMKERAFSSRFNSTKALPSGVLSVPLDVETFSENSKSAQLLLQHGHLKQKHGRLYHDLMPTWITWIPKS